jgi:hypothetical protein
MDGYLYHYTSLDTFKKILTNGIRLSRWKTLTADPFEKKLLTPTMDSDNGIKVYSSVQENFRVLCLCGDLNYKIEKEQKFFLPGYMHSRMWEKYGDGYKGVCLCFNADKLFHDFKSQYPISRYKEIQYVSPNFENSVNTKQKSKLHAGITIVNNNGILQEEILTAQKLLENEYFALPLFFSKFIDYRDESETRLIAYNESLEDCFIPIQNSLVRVYFGDKAKPKKELLVNQKINYFQLGIRNDKLIVGNSISNYLNPPKYFIRSAVGIDKK